MKTFKFTLLSFFTLMVMSLTLSSCNKDNDDDDDKKDTVYGQMDLSLTASADLSNYADIIVTYRNAQGSTTTDTLNKNAPSNLTTERTYKLSAVGYPQLPATAGFTISCKLKKNSLYITDALFNLALRYTSQYRIFTYNKGTEKRSKLSTFSKSIKATADNLSDNLSKFDREEYYTISNTDITARPSIKVENE